jgi:hypothetical protein
MKPFLSQDARPVDPPSVACDPDDDLPDDDLPTDSFEPDSDTSLRSDVQDQQTVPTGTHQAEKSFYVEKILSHKVSNGVKLYKVKWLGYGLRDCTWEPVSHLHPTLIANYHQRKRRRKAKR